MLSYRALFPVAALVRHRRRPSLLRSSPLRRSSLLGAPSERSPPPLPTAFVLWSFTRRFLCRPQRHSREGGNLLPPKAVRYRAYLQGGSTAPLVLRPCWVARPRSLCGALKRIGFSHHLQPATSAHNLHRCLSYSGSPRKKAPPPPLPRSSVRGHLWSGSGSRARRGARLRGEVSPQVPGSLFRSLSFGR